MASAGSYLHPHPYPHPHALRSRSGRGTDEGNAKKGQGGGRPAGMAAGGGDRRFCCPLCRKVMSTSTPPTTRAAKSWPQGRWQAHLALLPCRWLGTLPLRVQLRLRIRLPVLHSWRLFRLTSHAQTGARAGSASVRLQARLFIELVRELPARSAANAHTHIA